MSVTIMSPRTNDTSPHASPVQVQSKYDFAVDAAITSCVGAGNCKPPVSLSKTNGAFAYHTSDKISVTASGKYLVTADATNSQGSAQQPDVQVTLGTTPIGGGGSTTEKEAKSGGLGGVLDAVLNWVGGLFGYAYVRLHDTVDMGRNPVAVVVTVLRDAPAGMELAGVKVADVVNGEWVAYFWLRCGFGHLVRPAVFDNVGDVLVSSGFRPPDC